MSKLNSQKVLIVQFSQLGDILLTTPCLRELNFNGADVHFLSFPMGKLILKNNSYLKHHWILDPDASINNQWKLLRSLRAERFDVIFDFINTPRSAFVTRFARSKKSIAFESKRRFFYNVLVPADRSSLYIVDEKFLLLKKLGILPKNYLLDFFWFKKNLPEEIITFQRTLNTSKTIVWMSSTHKRLARRWPKEKFAVLADILVEKCNAKIIWCWGPGEEEIARECQILMRSESILAPSSTLEELGFLLAHGDIFIGNSNGPSHVAVSQRLPTLQIHGPTACVSWCPPIGHKAVGGECDIKQVSIESVIKAFYELSGIVKERKLMLQNQEITDARALSKLDSLMLPR